MMRPITCLSLIVALGAGLYLYQVKHRAQLLDQAINHTVKQSETARNRVGLLKAEWALLEDPQRLQELATRHLQLQPLQPAQFVRLEDLPSRLPAPVADPPPAMADAESPVAAAVPAPAAKPSTVLVAQASPPAMLDSRPAPRPAPVRPAPFRPAPPRPPRAATLASLNKPRPVYAPVLPLYEPAPVLVHAPTVQTASAMARISAPPTSFVGSALGMAGSSLAPPVPVGSPKPAAPAATSSLGDLGAR